MLQKNANYAYSYHSRHKQTTCQEAISFSLVSKISGYRKNSVRREFDKSMSRNANHPNISLDEKYD